MRIEDIDTPQVVPKSAEENGAAAVRLDWEGAVVSQSQRTVLYECALAQLRAKRLVYDWACSRAKL